MKILHVAQAYLPQFGGGPIRMQHLFEHLLAETSCEIHVLVPRTEEASVSYEQIDGVHVHRAPSYYSFPRAVRQIAKEWGIDLIHAHNARPAFFSWLAFMTNTPWLLEMHSIYYLPRLKHLLARFMYSRASKIVVLSHSSENVLVCQHRISQAKIDVIPNGVDTKVFSKMRVSEQKEGARERYGLGTEPVVGYAGSFYDWQGIEYLIKAIPFVVSQYGAVQFLLVGDGPLLEEARSMVGKLSVASWVVMPGGVPQDDMPALLDLMDVFVIPRPSTPATETAVPLKLLEAMALSKAIVATNVGGLLEVLQDGEDTVVVEAEDEEALAEGIMRLLTSRSLRDRLGDAARQKVVSSYDWAVSARRLLAVYEDLRA